MPRLVGSARRSLGFGSFVLLNTVLALAAPGYAAAQHAVPLVRVPTVDKADIRFAHVSLESAAVRGIINRMAQDDQGFLWLGTNHGLLRYDGHQFRAFTPDSEDPTAIRGTNILALTKDRSGHLWVASDQHVDKYDPVSGVFQYVLPDAANTCGPAGVVRDITLDRSGFVWVSTDNGLLRLDPTTSNRSCYQHRQGDESSLGSSRIMTTLESRDGGFWVATSRGLDELDRSTGKVTRRVILRGPSGTPLRLEGNKVTLFEDHAGVFWITIPSGQETGLASFDVRSGVQAAYLFGRGAAETAFSILEDDDHALWFGMWQQGIIRFDRERKEAVRYSTSLRGRDSLSPGAVVSLLQDRERRIWAGFDPPVIDRFDPRPSPFRIHRHDPADPDNLNNAVVAALEDSRGILWMGRLFGLDRIDRKTGHVTRYADKRVADRLIFRTVHAIAEDHTGHLWFGEWGNGLDRFDPRTGEYKFYNHDPAKPTSLSSDVVESLYVDRRGTLWVGTYEALDRFDPTTEQFQTFRSPVAGSSQYRAITQDRNGALWLASRGNGLHRFDPATGQFAVYRKKANDPRSLSNDIVNTVYADGLGTVWAGTSEGLCGLDQSTETFTCYRSRDGLASSVVEGILEDERGDLWLSTADGLSRFNPRTKTFRNYYAEDGLPSNEFRFGAASRSPSGEMFFGSTSGLLAFFPERVVDDSSPPSVVLTDFWLFGNRSGRDRHPLTTSPSYLQSLTLSPRQNIFSFEFSALNYSNSRRHRYQYRLENLEAQWNERDSSNRLVTYTTLPPGEYIFRVRATNSLGISNENGSGVRIHILPPWWSTWWFRGTSLVVGVAVFWGLYQWRIRQIQQQEKKLREALETIPAIAWMTSPTGAPEFVNRRWAEYTGLSAVDETHDAWRSVLHPDDADASATKWATSLASGEPFEDEVRVRRAADGAYRWFLTRAVPLRDRRGRILRWYGVMTDIEDRKEAARALESAEEALNRARSQLAHVARVTTLSTLTASIAHEVNQPLSGIITNAGTCLRMLDAEPPNVAGARETARRTIRDGQRASEVITRLRALFSKREFTLESLDLNEAMQEVIVLSRTELQRHGVALQAELADGLPSVTGDRIQLQQVMLNLLRNASEAMVDVHDRPRQLLIRTEREDGDRVRLSVRDAGVGIDAESMNKLFDPFYTTKSDGMGIGLSISRSIIERHHGRIWAEANEGPGATFSLSIPCDSGGQPILKAPGAPATRVTASRTP